MSKMSNYLIGNGIYLLLYLNDFLINILYIILNSVILIIKLLLYYIFDVNMIEGSKKRKRNPTESNQTVALRGVIDANWQKFLSNKLNMDTKEEKPPQKDHFTGAFRRARKKNSQKEILSTVFINSDMKGLNLESQVATGEKNKTSDVPNKRNKLTKFLAMDCEMVGVGYDGSDHMLARVSIVNKFGDCIYDKFVKAREEVKDYRTDVSGVRKEDLLNGEEFSVVQKDISELIKGRILVGHSLKNDLSVLFLSHPKKNIRDTSKYKPFRKVTKGSTPSLKRLAKEILGIDIQDGEHSPIEDARAAMQLYCTVSKKWEASLSDKRGHRKISDE